jgi:SPP1 gp7 family putative phage head morphogenesis protein
MALTEKQEEQAKKHRKYWKDREDEALENYQKSEAEYDKEIHRIYSDMLDGFNKEINAFYGKYATAEGITLAEAKKRVSELDIKEYERKAARYVKDASLDRKANKGKTNKQGYYFSEKANEEMRLYNLTMKVNRLEMLKANIGLEMIKGHAELETFMSGVLRGRTEEELARQAGILGKTVRNNAKLAHAIPNASFHNATFSDRVWAYHDIMKADLEKLLTRGLIQGKNPRQLARELEKYVIGDAKGGARFNAERLMRTELARVQTEAQKQSFERNGFDKYIFIVNSGCCDLCTQAAKKDVGYGEGVYLVKDMMPAENAAPMHPHCRCSAAAYSDRKEYDEWLDFLEKGGTTAEYEKLKAKGAKIPIVPKKAEKGNKTHSKAYETLEAEAKANNVEYNEVQPLGKKLSSEEIIKRVGGGDKTEGSCASLVYAYIGNRGGFDVLDFRGGNSLRTFSKKGCAKTIATLDGVRSVRVTSNNDFTAVAQLLSKAEKGKEYYLSTGKHASIIRKTDKGFEYLELQHPTDNGFKPLTTTTLKTRFGCKKSNTVFGGKVEVDNLMIDVESLAESEEFIEILGYLNTAETAQRKGLDGEIK